MNIFWLLPDVDLLTKHSNPNQRKHRKKLFRRRNSTGSVGVMNSHALNLQTSGHQAVAVGHHRGFSQPSTANTGDPWFLQTAHEMPPTAPTRQHKRPAPQPGSLIHTNGPVNHQSHHHTAVNVSIIPMNANRQRTIGFILFQSQCQTMVLIN